MLNFPAWKVSLIALVLLFGAALALPNLFSDSTVGIEPRPPSDLTNTQAVEDYEREKAIAEASNWPSWFSNKLNLGLDLQGGVYLLMEIEGDDIVKNRLEGFRDDVRTAWRQSGGRANIFREEIALDDPTNLTYRLLVPEGSDVDAAAQAQDALSRIERVNPTVGDQQVKVFTYDLVDDEYIRITVSPASREALAADAQGKMMTIVRRRVDPDGVAEVSITPQGQSRIILEAPGEADPRRIKDILERAGRLTFNMAELSPSEIQAAQRRGGQVSGNRSLIPTHEGGLVIVSNIVEMDGSDVVSANRGFDRANLPAVDFRLSDSAARKFYDLTSRNRGRHFAIILDGVAMSTPVIREPIPGGNVQISGGNFSIDEADDLAAIIEAGELPAKLKFLDERTVGPTLGAESIRAGSMASLIGLVLVGVFMLLAYGMMGSFAVGSLMTNIVLIIGALSGFGATLTLPGIAGIILTIGMAVDANVVVFERIREEQAAGRSPATAVQVGYERAFSAILDANVTTFIAAVILYWQGAGPVKGFAVTLAIGIVTSVFTAFVVTRWFTSMYLRGFRPKRLAM